MKTVIDAVNEFKGVYFDGECGDEDHQDEVVVALDDFSDYQLGDIKIGSGNSGGNRYWKVICTREQFNQCVDEMATNYGTSETYANYKVNFEMINDDMKPVAVPTFTQEMADAGTLPSVGMECLCSFEDGEWEKVLIDFISEILAVVTDKDSAQYSLPIKEVVFKPLTPPIELIDGKAYQFDIEFVGTVCGVYYKAHDELNGSEDNYPSEICTNIQLLGVTS